MITKMINKYQPYTSRNERNKFLAVELSDYIGVSVLNVGGGGRKHLKRYLNNDVSYTEIDIDGSPDVLIDLEVDAPLPFGDGYFDTVIATDVLEHIDSFHRVLDEMKRISSKYIIISLPNPWAGVKHALITGRYDGGKYYGLPMKKPEDRHKWFFSYTDAESFLIEYSKRNSLEIKEMFPINYSTESFKKNLIRKCAELVYGDSGRKNLFATTIWCVFEKTVYGENDD